MKGIVIAALAIISSTGVLIMTSSCVQKRAKTVEYTNWTGSAKLESVSDEVTVMDKMSLRGHVGMYWKFFFEKGQKVPVVPLPQKKSDLEQLFGKSSDTLKASWLGHSSMLINIDGYTVLTDPLFEKKVSVVGPSRFNGVLPVEVADLPPIDAVIISHNHYDHLNRSSIQQLTGKTNVFIVPLRVGKTLLQWGIPQEKIIELDWWEKAHPGADLTIVATPSQHFSGRGLMDHNKTLWASWVIRTGNHNLFFSGDSGYFTGFREIGEKYGPFDVTFLECGAYNERWPKVHMFPEQTVQAFTDLGGKILQPIHWATFNLALHTWYEPIERLIDEAWRRNVPVSSPMIGQVVDYDKELDDDSWWLPAKELSLKGRRQETVADSSVPKEKFVEQE